METNQPVVSQAVTPAPQKEKMPLGIKVLLGWYSFFIVTVPLSMPKNWPGLFYLFTGFVLIFFFFYPGIPARKKSTRKVIIIWELVSIIYAVISIPLEAISKHASIGVTVTVIALGSIVHIVILSYVYRKKDYFNK